MPLRARSKESPGVGCGDFDAGLMVAAAPRSFNLDTGHPLGTPTADPIDDRVDFAQEAFFAARR